MTAPRNPCRPHDWELMAAGFADYCRAGETKGVRVRIESWRCDKCLEVRHTDQNGDPEKAATFLPGHFKCIEHGRYNCAEEDHA